MANSCRSPVVSSTPRQHTQNEDHAALEVAREARYADWPYVLIEAGPEQARVWREDCWDGVLPDLMFPADRSWLFSTLWDDDWACIGGSRELVDAFLAQPDLHPRVREVDPTIKDATPPGHTAS